MSPCGTNKQCKREYRTTQLMEGGGWVGQIPQNTQNTKIPQNTQGNLPFHLNTGLGHWGPLDWAHLPAVFQSIIILYFFATRSLGPLRGLTSSWWRFEPAGLCPFHLSSSSRANTIQRLGKGCLYIIFQSQFFMSFIRAILSPRIALNNGLSP